MSKIARHACRACGYRTIVAPEPGPPGTMHICPVCFWEDGPQGSDEIADADMTGGSNQVTLVEAQRNFAAIGAVEELHRSAVRAPLPEEERDPAWRSRDQAKAAARAELLAAIERAFAGVSRAGGISLHETEVIDRYGDKEEARRAQARDHDRCWQEVPHQDLAEVCGIGGICFFDPIGWRYYLPAYMTWFVSGGETSHSIAADFLIYNLRPEHPAVDPHLLKRYQSLDARQASVVAQFLQYIVRFGTFFQSDARAALTRYWEARSRT